MNDAMTATAPGALTDDVKQIIADTLKIDPAAIGEDTKLIEADLSLGSLQLIEVMVAIEKKFEVTMEGELMRIENFATVRTLSEAVARVLA